MIQATRIYKAAGYLCVQLGLLLFNSHLILAMEPPPDYATVIAPLLSKYCIACHDANAAEGGLAMDSYASLIKGGEHGPAVLEGDAAASRLYRLITGLAEPHMPPEDNPAPEPEEIAIIKAWIDAGAHGPNGAEPDRTQLLVPKIPSPVKQLPIAALAWSPNGKLLAVARFGAIDLLDAGTRRPIRELRDHPGKVTAVVFTPDGKALIAASGIEGLFGEARLWDVENGSVKRAFGGHRDIVYAAALSPDGTLLATSSYDKRTILWNVATGEELRRFEGHNDAIYDACFSMNGRVLATASGDHTVKLWRVEDGEQLDTLSQSLKEQFSVAFSPDGKYLVAGGADNRIRLWELVSDEEPKINPLLYTRFAHEGAIVGLRFSYDGKQMASSAADGTVKLWKTDSYTQTYDFPRQPDIVHALAFSPDGTSLAVGRMDGSLELLPVPDIEEMLQPAVSNDTVAETVANTLPNTQSVIEVEPNNSPDRATSLILPAKATGTIQSTNSNDDKNEDVDFYRIASQRGQQWVFEIDAARSESLLDSKLDILDADGRPVMRLLLEAVRDSYISFRGIDSSTRDVRLFGWEEMDLNQFVYFQGEVCKTFRMPGDPDDGVDFYPHDGARHCFFDTSAAAHALYEPCYVVQPHPPGVKLRPNGLPVFPLYYENDDDGLRRMGRDSRLTFTAPDDGTYYVRVSDVRGVGGPKHNYTLNVRPRRQDFTVNIVGKNFTIAAGSGKTFIVNLERIDEFEGEVLIELAGELPKGYAVSSPLVIEDGHLQARGVIYAEPDASEPTPEQAAQVKFTATAMCAGQRIVKEIGDLGSIKLAAKPQIGVQLLPDSSQLQSPANGEGSTPSSNEIIIAPGQSTSATLRIERNGVNEAVNLEIKNLPFGVSVANLESQRDRIVIPEGESERKIELTAYPWVRPASRLIYGVLLDAVGNPSAHDSQSSAPVILRIQDLSTN